MRRSLAAEENADCEFIVMDAENVDFPDGTFDVVISRNLTWTLPHVRRALPGLGARPEKRAACF